MTKTNLFVKPFQTSCIPVAQLPFNSKNNNRQAGGACGKNGRRLRTGVYAVFLCCAFLVSVVTVTAQQPAISSFSPSSGAVGTVITLAGTDLSNPTSVTIGGVSAIVISGTATKTVVMVMPGTITGQVSLATAGGSSTATGSFTVTPAVYPTAQRGDRLVGTGFIGGSQQGYSVSISGDGNTALVGGRIDDFIKGAAWVYTRNSGGVWTQQGNKLTGVATGLNNGALEFGKSVSLSADGNTALIGGVFADAGTGGAWVFTRTAGVWTQQGDYLVGAGGVGVQFQGYSVSLSADGNTALVGGLLDDDKKGAAWVFSRSGGVWTQLGDKLVGSDATSNSNTIRMEEMSVSLSADGNTALVGKTEEGDGKGAAWIFTRTGGLFTQKGGKLVGTGTLGNAGMGKAVSLSADGTTALVSGYTDDGDRGAVWVFTLSNGDWIQQGPKLKVNEGFSDRYGSSVSISADGNTALVGGASLTGVWVHTRSGGAWTPGSKIDRGDSLIGQTNVQLSADGSRAVLGDFESDVLYVGSASIYEDIPFIIAQKSFDDFGPSCIGSTSAPLSYTVSGLALEGPITVTAPVGYEVSKTASSGYAPDITLTAVNRTVSKTTLYIRISATAPAGSLTGEVVATSANATTRAVSVTGTVRALPLTPVIDPATATTFCAGESVLLTSSTESGNRWYWHLNNDEITTAKNEAFNARIAGSYTVFVKDPFDCISPLSIPVVVTVHALPSRPTINVSGATTFCAGGEVVLTSSASTGNQWLLNGSPINNADRRTYPANTTGNYSVRETDRNGCTGPNAAVRAVTVNPLPVTPVISTSTPTIFCAGGQVVLTSSASAGNQWLLNGSPISNATGNTYTATASGNYSVRVTDGNSCTSADATAVMVTVNPLPPTPVISNTTPTAFCIGGQVVLTSSALTGNQWALNGSPVSGATGRTYTANTSGNYSVRTTDGNNCTSAATATVVTVHPLPSGTIVKTAFTTNVVAGFLLTAPAGAVFAWNTGENTPSVKAQSSGDYSVVVTTAHGCQDQFATQVVLPSLTDATQISIPNSFSPNGDGINDYWTIPELKNYPNAQVTIVNRSGSVVYQSNNTIPKWDGKYKGKDLPAGVYFYNVQPLPGMALKSGWVNLLR